MPDPSRVDLAPRGVAPAPLPPPGALDGDTAPAAPPPRPAEAAAAAEAPEGAAAGLEAVEEFEVVEGEEGGEECASVLELLPWCELHALRWEIWGDMGRYGEIWEDRCEHHALRWESEELKRLERLDAGMSPHISPYLPISRSPRSGIRVHVSKLALERTRTQLYPAVFRRIPLCSLSSHPPRTHALL